MTNTKLNYALVVLICRSSVGCENVRTSLASASVLNHVPALRQAAAVPAAVVPGAPMMDLGFLQHQGGAVDLANFLPAPACAGPQPGVQTIPLQLCSCALLSRLHFCCHPRVHVVHNSCAQVTGRLCVLPDYA